MTEHHTSRLSCCVKIQSARHTNCSFASCIIKTSVLSCTYAHLVEEKCKKKCERLRKLFCTRLTYLADRIADTANLNNLVISTNLNFTLSNFVIFLECFNSRTTLSRAAVCDARSSTRKFVEFIYFLPHRLHRMQIQFGRLITLDRAHVYQVSNRLPVSENSRQRRNQRFNLDGSARRYLWNAPLSTRFD